MLATYLRSVPRASSAKSIHRCQPPEAAQTPGDRLCHASTRRVQAGSRACSWPLRERLSQQGQGERLAEVPKMHSCDRPHARATTATAQFV